MFELIDLNEKNQTDCVVFNPNEIRSFIYMLTPLDKKTYKINKFIAEQLGQLEIKWTNYLGDAGILKVGPFKYSIDSSNRFQVEIQQAQDQDRKLILEEPSNMRFRIFNLSTGNMTLNLDIEESEQSDIRILSIENGTEKVGFLKPGDSQEFVLRLFAQRMGIVNVSGLLIKDTTSGRDILFQVFSSI